MPKKTQQEAVQIEIREVQQGHLEVFVVGSSPLVINRMSEKAKHELLHPRGRLNAYQKQTSLKHDPIAEFKAAPHTLTSPSAESLLAMPSTAFKAALSTAALDLPGAKKAQIARLTYVENEYVPIFGLPKLYMAVVRSADMNHTPDIRTRVIVPEWASHFTVKFVKPILSPNAVANLLANGGVYIGVGDGRPEKGKLSFGRFHLAHKGLADAEYKRIVKYGRRLQQAAMDRAEPYDAESAEMLTWWTNELKRRDFRKAEVAENAEPIITVKKGRSAGVAAA